MKTTYEQIVNIPEIGKSTALDLNPIFELAEKEELEPANKDAIRRLLLCIDVQKDFMEGGPLGVTGSIDDVERITRFIYNNMEGITRIMCSLDTHAPHQIFHPCWWRNCDSGEHPAPYTIITYDNVKAGIWEPLIAVKESTNYLKELENLRKKQLCIWPYHCIEGTDGATLENEFAKMINFHAVARKAKAITLPKGKVPYSEMYGIIKPEYTADNFINTPVLNAIENFDEVYVVGEAASHCLLESVKQIAEHFSNRPEITQKITVLEDCTSPIKTPEKDYTAETAAAFTNFKNMYGIKFSKSTEIQF